VGIGKSGKGGKGIKMKWRRPKSMMVPEAAQRSHRIFEREIFNIKHLRGY
jgi:hypothetical protein